MAYTVISLNKNGEVITDEYLKERKIPDLQEVLSEVWARIERQQKEKISTKKVND